MTAGSKEAEPRTLDQLCVAHQSLEKLFDDFKKEMEEDVKSASRVDNEEYVLEKFYESALYKQFVKDEATNEYKGRLSDPITPLDYYIADSMHAGLRLGVFVHGLVMLQAQRIENAHQGFGVHAYYAAACVTGFRHFGEKAKAFAKTELKAKMCLLNGICASDATENPVALSHSAEKVKEFREMLSKKSMTKERLTEILVQTRKYTSKLEKDVGKTKKPASLPKSVLAATIGNLFDYIQDDDIIIKHIMSNEECFKIDSILQLRLYEKVVVENSLIDMAELLINSGCKVNGRDSEKLICLGAAKKQIRLLSSHFTTKHMKVNEASRKLINQVVDIDSELQAVKAAKKKLVKQLDSLHDICDEKINIEDFEDQVMTCFNELGHNYVEADNLRDDILEVGGELIDLYTNCGEELEMDEFTNQLLEIVESIEEVMNPILKPKYPDSVQDMINDFKENHDARVQRLINALEKCPAAQSAHGSDYMEWLVCHAKYQCLFTLEVLDRHISEFNCQTTEHFNKLLKRLVERLHGFANRGVGNSRTPVAQGGVNIYNKFGFVMRECTTRLLHFFPSIVNKCPQQRKCTKCRKVGHYRSTCLEIDN
jgi:hypothetical protein